MATALQPAPEFTFKRTFDMSAVWKIMTYPPTYRMITEDTSPADPNDFWPTDHPSIWYILAHDAEGLLFACFALFPESSACWSLHSCCAPEVKRVRSRAPLAMQALYEWVWHQTACRRIITRVPAYNHFALQMAEKSHMLRFGENLNSFPKYGKLWNEILLGISRPEVT